MDELKSGKRKTPSNGWFEICKKEKNPTADKSIRMHSQCQSGGGLSFTHSSTVTTKTCIFHYMKPHVLIWKCQKKYENVLKKLIVHPLPLSKMLLLCFQRSPCCSCPSRPSCRLAFPSTPKPTSTSTSASWERSGSSPSRPSSGRTCQSGRSGWSPGSGSQLRTIAIKKLLRSQLRFFLFQLRTIALKNLSLS